MISPIPLRIIGLDTSGKRAERLRLCSDPGVAGVRVIFCAVRAVHPCFFLGSEFDQDSPYPGTGVHNWLYGTALFAAIAEDLKQRGLCCIKS